MTTRSGLHVWVRRVCLLGLGFGGLAAGLALGSSGCSRCECPGFYDPELSLYDIIRSDARPELVGGIVELSSERVEISFTDLDGNSWVIDYSH